MVVFTLGSTTASPARRHRVNDDFKTEKRTGESSHSIQLENKPASLHTKDTTKMAQKNSFLKKQSGRVVENKGKWPKTNRKRTGNKATEVVENTESPEKQSENKPKNKAGHLIENTGPKKQAKNRLEIFSSYFVPLM